jgi:hypothetical protein
VPQTLGRVLAAVATGGVEIAVKKLHREAMLLGKAAQFDMKINRRTAMKIVAGKEFHALG